MSVSNGVEGKIEREEIATSTPSPTLEDTADYITEPSQPSDQKISQLCTYCQNVGINWDAFYAGANFPHFSDRESLKASASTCKLCAQLAQEVPFERQWEDSKQFWGDKTWDAYPPGIIKLDKNLPTSTDTIRVLIPQPTDRWNSGGVGFMSHEYKVFWCFKDALNSEFCIASANQSGLNTRDGLPLVKKWLNECLSSHAECKPPEDQPLPTRLLFLGDSKVKLCHSVDIKERQNYATLSHSWGKVKFLTLLKSNVEAFQREIPSDALSQTFLEAIEVARYLGFDFLWIDSMCIIQDDADDWAKESTLMCTVYGSSALNIAASGARDGSSVGFLHSRPSNWRCQIPLTTSNENAAWKNIECYQKEVEYKLRSTSISERGWVVQERVLSHRTAHFTDKQTYWECNSHICCEILPTTIANDTTFRQPYTKSRTTIENWPAIVLAYSDCHLTYESDRLVALSGLAQLVHADSGIEYVAGMWRQGLPIQLCWHIMVRTSAAVYDNYVAPSWSWAAVPEAIYGVHLPAYNLIPDQEFITVENIEMKYATSNPFSSITSATLRLSCELLARATVALAHPFRPSFNPHDVCIGGEKVACTIMPDIGMSIEKEQIDVFVLIVALVEGTYKGLILRHVGDTGRYERMGLLESPVETPVKGRDKGKRTVVEVMREGGGWVLEGMGVEVVVVEGRRRFLVDLV